MSASLKRFIEKSVSGFSSLGKPIASTGAELGRMAAGQIEEMLAPARPRFAAFISYSHRDMDCARWLHKAIETYRVPRALVGTQGDFGAVPPRLRPVFRDGGCVLLADVARSREPGDWLASPSRLRLSWSTPDHDPGKRSA